jgi:signal transduction histidine kinase
MLLADYIEANKQRLIDRWKQMVDIELPFNIDESELLNELPDVIDDLILAAREPFGNWPDLESARSHGRQRMKIGFNLGKLTVEMALIAEALLCLADEDDIVVSSDEMRLLFRIISRGTEASVDAYAQMRDRQLANQAAQHFSFIAHEIRNPLQNAKLAISLLGAAPEGQRPRYVDRLDRSLDQLSDLVDNSLTEARLLGSPEMNIERLDAAELVEDACDDVSAHAENRGVELTREVEDFEIEADRKLVHSALTNVIKNAVKFTGGNTSVGVTARVENDRAVFEVRDECGGLPAAIANSLFEPFVQAQADGRGFGLGLAIVKQAVSAHGGTVHVDDLPGHGCNFVIELPLRQPSSNSSS